MPNTVGVQAAASTKKTAAGAKITTKMAVKKMTSVSFPDTSAEVICRAGRNPAMKMMKEVRKVSTTNRSGLVWKRSLPNKMSIPSWRR